MRQRTFAIARSATCGSFTISCRSLQPLKTSRSPFWREVQSKKEALQEAIHWLDEVGLADRSTHRAGELSGGEQQRVSIARALITTPKLLLADEPTGDLDNQTADALFALIERLHASYGLTSILVTHNLPLARRCERVLRLAHGRVEELSPLEV